MAFPKLLENLYLTANGEGLLEENVSKLLAIYHDHPEFTNKEQLRTSLCFTVPIEASISERSTLGSLIISGGLYVVGHFNILVKEFSGAWDYMYGEWLLYSGYEPRASFPFEVYLNDSSIDPEQKLLVDIYLPIQPLQFSSHK